MLRIYNMEATVMLRIMLKFTYYDENAKHDEDIGDNLIIIISVQNIHQ